VAALERVERRSILVLPACSTVSAYCTQLTTLTQADVDAGIPLAEACRVLADEYKARERLFASFGDYDRQQFERNCAAFGLAYPFGPTHLNVKNLAAVAYGWSREVGMRESALYVSEALERAGLPLEGLGRHVIHLPRGARIAPCFSRFARSASTRTSRVVR